MMGADTEIPEEVHEAHDDDHPRRVVAYAMDLPRGHFNQWHSHARGQLLYTRSGAVTVTTEVGLFVLPPNRAVWIPPHAGHSARYLTDSQLRTIYVRTTDVEGLPSETTAVNVSPLLRELLLAFMTFPRDYSEAGAQGRLVGVMLDQVVAAPGTAFRLPQPETPKLRDLADQIRDNPGASRSTDVLAAGLAMSLRTFERRFSRETGMPFRTWRNRAKMLKALELLSVGTSVGETSDLLGYEGQSAFIAGFRSTFGTTPGRYFTTPTA